MSAASSPLGGAVLLLNRPYLKARSPGSRAFRTEITDRASEKFHESGMVFCKSRIEIFATESFRASERSARLRADSLEAVDGNAVH